MSGSRLHRAQPRGRALRCATSTQITTLTFRRWLAAVWSPRWKMNDRLHHYLGAWHVSDPRPLAETPTEYGWEERRGPLISMGAALFASTDRTRKRNFSNTQLATNSSQPEKSFGSCPGMSGGGVVQPLLAWREGLFVAEQIRWFYRGRMAIEEQPSTAVRALRVCEFEKKPLCREYVVAFGYPAAGFPQVPRAVL